MVGVVHEKSTNYGYSPSEAMPSRNSRLRGHRRIRQIQETLSCTWSNPEMKAVIPADYSGIKEVVLSKTAPHPGGA